MTINQIKNDIIVVAHYLVAQCCRLPAIFDVPCQMYR